MEFNIKFDEQMMVEAANRVLDEFEYKGKTIREWADTLTHPQTNADRLRSMSDKELAERLATVPMSYEEVCPNPMPKECKGGDMETCIQCWLDWLRKEASDEP